MRSPDLFSTDDGGDTIIIPMYVIKISGAKIPCANNIIILSTRINVQCTGSLNNNRSFELYTSTRLQQPVDRVI